MLALSKRCWFYHCKVTHSSGNHGQALAWAAKTAGLPCSVVVPNNSPAVKQEAIEEYGAELVLCEPTPQSRYNCTAVIFDVY